MSPLRFRVVNVMTKTDLSSPSCWHGNLEAPPTGLLQSGRGGGEVVCQMGSELEAEDLDTTH